MKKPASNQPVPPQHLSPAMSDLWQKLTRDFEFSAEHLSALELTCGQFDIAEACRERIAQDGLVLPNGRKHALLAVQAKAVELFLRGVKDLGLQGEVNRETT